MRVSLIHHHRRKRRVSILCGSIRVLLCGSLRNQRLLRGLLRGLPALRVRGRQHRRLHRRLHRLARGGSESPGPVDFAERQANDQHAVGEHYARVARADKPKSEITAGQQCSLSSMSFRRTVSWSSIEASLADTQESSGQQARLNASSSKSGMNSQTSRSEVSRNRNTKTVGVANLDRRRLQGL